MSGFRFRSACHALAFPNPMVPFMGHSVVKIVSVSSRLTLSPCLSHSNGQWWIECSAHKAVGGRKSSLVRTLCWCMYIGEYLRAVDEVKDIDADWVALCGPVLAVQVVEVSGQALVESSLATECQRTVTADGPSRGVDGTSLRGLVELKLVVGSNVTCSALAIGKDTTLECHGEHTRATACNHLRHGRASSSGSVWLTIRLLGCCRGWGLWLTI